MDRQAAVAVEQDPRRGECLIKSEFPEPKLRREESMSGYNPPHYCLKGLTNEDRSKHRCNSPIQIIGCSG